MLGRRCQNWHGIRDVKATSALAWLKAYLLDGQLMPKLIVGDATLALASPLGDALEALQASVKNLSHIVKIVPPKVVYEPHCQTIVIWMLQHGFGRFKA